LTKDLDSVNMGQIIFRSEEYTDKSEEYVKRSEEYTKRSEEYIDLLRGA